MDKNSLVNIIYQKSEQRRSSKKLDVFKQKINSKIQFPQKMESVKDSSRMIKITQFNSSLIINENRIKNGYKTSSSSPQKNFNIKKVSEVKNKAIANAQKIIEIELKRKGKSTNKKIHVQDFNRNQEVHKMLAASKWSLRSENSNYELGSSSNLSSQTVIVLKSPQRRQQVNQKCINKSQLGDNILIGQQKDLRPKEPNTRVPSKQKIKPSFDSQQVFIGSIETDKFQFPRKFSASPRKGYSRHIQEQKKYQDNIQRQKRQILEMKRQLNKNYAKPFNPPENITAFSYIIYEADAKRNKKLRKISARRYEAEQLTEIKKIFLHSHQVIVSMNSRTAVQIASLTKIMTCMIALDLSKRFNLNLNDQIVTIGLFEQNIGGTSANIKKGQIYSIKQLLYGLMLPSGNDASLAIAVWGGKALLQRQGYKKQNEVNSLSTTINAEQKVKPKIKKRQYYLRFIHEMNLKASELNMQKTKYVNSHGLSNPQNRSCTFDLAILSEYAMNNQQFRQIVSCKAYQTQIKIQTDLCSKELQSSKESKKLLKKKSGVSINRQGQMQFQQMKDMDEMFEDQFLEQEQIANQEQKQMEAKSIKWQNTHQLLQQKSDLYIGIKTGVTNTAGPCLASCIQVNGRRFIIIVLNCKSMKYRMKDTQILRKWLFGKESIKYHEKGHKIVIQEQNSL